MTHQKKLWHLKVILLHATTNPILVPNVPAEPDSDPSLSYSSSSGSSDSSDDNYYKQIQYTNNNNNKFLSKKNFNEPIKKCAKFTAKLLTAAYKSKVIKLKLDEDTILRQFYFLYFINSLLKHYFNLSKLTCSLWTVHT